MSAMKLGVDSRRPKCSPGIGALPGKAFHEAPLSLALVMAAIGNRNGFRSTRQLIPNPALRDVDNESSDKTTGRVHRRSALS